ncbi:MAG: sigma-54 dependent transcriptional regulator [Syntrophales bacterium]|jgi:two-component system response regulator PilR (NtrC family)|nr:sigma-54 dependent transcriptional regulator [Syntrophales bacterium]MCK9527456.1 sigma-54 dependent transcriptional regulator [Syntrophales bacterium]MDX9921560.1 sigma-54 dependent transcriptional regulator [Syntrophales bacterium]
MANILVVDDDQGMRDLLEIMLAREGHTVATAPGGREALHIFEKKPFDLVITDLRMPRVDGIGLLRSIKELSPETVVVLVTAYASGETALAAMKEGAYDYLEKNFNIDRLTSLVNDALEKKGSLQEEARFMKTLEQSPGFSGMVGKSKGMLKLYSMVRKVADTGANVLILGESGTGKELVARSIHENSPRKTCSFVVINCGGIPETLLESELFGYMKGSFSGAYGDKPGLFEHAQGGTIFLDEIGELSPFLQVKLLRVVQEKTFRRIGGADDITVDARIISATNQDLEAKVAAKEFREDLYYRLNVIPLRIPPLRERREDIPLLVNYFIEKYAGELGRSVQKISDYALELLLTYPFPGNVRELENIIERSVAMERSAIILPESLLLSGTGLPDSAGDAPESIPAEGVDLNQLLERYEARLIEEALKKADGSKSKAARLLKITPDSLRYRIENKGGRT